MAETTLLRSNNIARNASPGATSGKAHATVSGQHKTVNVTMGTNGPQVNNGQAQLKQGVTILPPKAGTRNFTTGGLPNQGAKSTVTVFPPKDPRFAASPANAMNAPEVVPQQLTADQLLLCRHLVDKYLGEVKTAAGEAQLDQAATDNVQLADATIVAIDKSMAAITDAAAAAAVAASAPPAPAPTPAPRAVTVGARQIAASAAPRRVARPAPPPVVVKMEGKLPVQQSAPQAPVQQPEAPAVSPASSTETA